MLKKVAIGSAITLLVCLIVMALLAPKAVADTIDMAEDMKSKYEAVNEQLSVTPDNVAAVTFSGGYGVQLLQVTPSPDHKIHIYTDDFHLPNTQFTYVVDEETGMMAISNYWRGNPWKELTRENILKQIVREFSGSTPYVELQLPEGVAYDLHSINVWSYELDQEVQTMRSGRYGYSEDDEYYDEPLDGESSSAEPVDPVTGLSAERVLEITRSVMEENNRMRDTYRAYAARSIEAPAFWDTVHPLLGRTAKLLAPLAGYADEWETDELADQLNQYMDLAVTRNLSKIGQKRLDQQYLAGEIEKEEYYSRDLEYDSEQSNLEDQMNSVDYDGSMDDLFDRFEQALGFELVFAEDVDLEDIAGIR